jgi:DNA-binding beta-propeller fold protein YncE
MSTLSSRRFFFARLAGLLPVLALAVALPARAASVVARFEVGGEGGYDYIRFDPGTNRLFVAHGTRVEVLDAGTGAKVGTIAPTNGVHGIAIAPEFGHGFITDGADRSVTMFDPRTLAILKVIKYTGAKPDAIEYDPQTKRVFVANGDAKAGGDLTVIDARTGSITDTVDLGGKLEGMAFDGRGHLFVAAEDKALIHVVDTARLARIAQWPLAPGEEPTGMAIDAASHRLFAACANQRLVVLDSDTGRVVATPAIAPDPDGAAFDPGTGRIYASSREGILSVIHEETPDRFSADESVTTAPGARTLTLDPKSHRVFLPTGRFEPGIRSPAPGSFVVLVVGPK